MKVSCVWSLDRFSSSGFVYEGCVWSLDKFSSSGFVYEGCVWSLDRFSSSDFAIIYWLFSESNIFAGGRGMFATSLVVVPFQSIWTIPVVFNPPDTRDVLLTRVTWLIVTTQFFATVHHTPIRLYFWLFSMSQCQDSTDYHTEYENLHFFLSIVCPRLCCYKI